MHQTSLWKRLRLVWYWFLPAWTLPIYFLLMRPIGELIGVKTMLSIFFAIFLGSMIAIKAKKVFNWGEFYLFYILIPVAVLAAGVAVALVMKMPS
jgi:hypothetical protein